MKRRFSHRRKCSMENGMRTKHGKREASTDFRLPLMEMPHTKRALETLTPGFTMPSFIPPWATIVKYKKLFINFVLITISPILYVHFKKNYFKNAVVELIVEYTLHVFWFIITILPLIFFPPKTWQCFCITIVALLQLRKILFYCEGDGMAGQMGKALKSRTRHEVSVSSSFSLLRSRNLSSKNLLWPNSQVIK